MTCSRCGGPCPSACPNDTSTSRPVSGDPPPPVRLLSLTIRLQHRHQHLHPRFGSSLPSFCCPFFLSLGAAAGSRHSAFSPFPRIYRSLFLFLLPLRLRHLPDCLTLFFFSSLASYYLLFCTINRLFC